jgi:hypothetical protein
MKLQTGDKVAYRHVSLLDAILARLVVAAIIIVLFFFVAFFIINGRYILNPSRIVAGTGTLVHLDFEGGFYGIISDKGEHYDIVNSLVPQEDLVNGLRVKFVVFLEDNGTSYHMWGVQVTLIDIRPRSTEQLRHD